MDMELTNPGTALGTVSYMSPEQARGQLADARTDLFSLGTVLYQMATGVLPFQGDTSAVVYDAILNRDPVPVTKVNPAIPAEYSRIVDKAIEKDRNLRYQTATDLKTDLARLKRDLESGGKRAAEGGESRPTRQSEQSVAVLYFENVSGIKEDEYFRDGITEDIITELSKIRGLKIFSRPPVLAYRDKQVTPAQIGQKLRAAYVLTGSVRRSGNRLRISGQLIDTGTDFPLWSERYDRDLKGIFALQDEITQKILTALQVKLTQGEQELLLVHKYPDNLEAYDYFLRGWTYYFRFTKETNTQAQQMFERAVNLDPKFAAAYAGLSIAYLQEWVNQWSQDPQTLEQVLKLGQRAVALEDSLPLAHTALSWVYLLKKQLEQAIAETERAIALDPNYALGYADLAMFLNLAGQPEEAIGLAEKAMRLDPHYPAFFVSYLGQSYYLLRRYEEAIAAQKRALTLSPDFLYAHAFLAASYSESGRAEEAWAEAAEVLRVSPNFSLEVLWQMLPSRDPETDRILAALRKAGMK